MKILDLIDLDYLTLAVNFYSSYSRDFNSMYYV